MHFRDLYNIVVSELSEPPVRFEYLRHLINVHHAGVGEIKTWAIHAPEPNHQAHYVLLGTDRTSPYDDEFDIAEIRYCSGLNDHPRHRRFALTKELMHVFDRADEMTDTREKFLTLVGEIQNQPLPGDSSAMYHAELGTKWMALIVLCPPRLRDTYYNAYIDGQIDAIEIAEQLRLPEELIPPLMSDYYLSALDHLLKR